MCWPGECLAAQWATNRAIARDEIAVSELKDKAGIVTGAGVGIGRAIAVAMARAGARVVVADLNIETANETADLIKAAGGDAVAFKADVSDEAQVKALVRCCVEHYGALNVACNSAAVSRGSGQIHTYDRDVFDSTLELCLTNTFLCLKHEVEAMLNGDGGSIVQWRGIGGGRIWAVGHPRPETLRRASDASKERHLHVHM